MLFVLGHSSFLRGKEIFSEKYIHACAVCVCVCVCVCERDRQRQTDRQTDRQMLCMCACLCMYENHNDVKYYMLTCQFFLWVKKKVVVFIAIFVKMS